jgi:hypothetical protein
MEAGRESGDLCRGFVVTLSGWRLRGQFLNYNEGYALKYAKVDWILKIKLPAS